MIPIIILLIALILFIWILLKWPLQLIIEWSCTKEVIYQRFALRIFKRKLLNKEKRIISSNSLEDINLAKAKKRIHLFLTNKTIKQQLQDLQRTTSLEQLSLVSEIGFKNPIHTSMSTASIWMLKSILLSSLWNRINVPEEAVINVQVQPNFQQEIFYIKMRFEGKVPVKEMLRMYIMAEKQPI